MATSRLQLYNIALRSIGERSLDSLTEDREPRRILDEVYTEGNGGAVRYFLESGRWNFAMRTIKVDKSSDVEPAFGFVSAFLLPDDFVKLDMISWDERFEYPVTRYEKETQYIHGDGDPLYLRFVSDRSDFGADFSLWPEKFTQWAGKWLGIQIAPRLKNDLDMDRLEKRENMALIRARSDDAQEEPPRWPPMSSWNQSRFGRYSQRERGNRSQLIG